MTWGVGIVGGGFGARVQLPAFRKDPRCQVLALCARHLAPLRPYQVKTLYSDWRKLIQDSRIQIVSLAVPPELQPKIARAALKLKKHVFMEKPVSNQLRQLQTLNPWVHRKSPVVSVDFEFPELNSWKEASEILKKKELGAIEGASLSWTPPYRINSSALSWKDSIHKGGGLLFNFGSHVFYNLEWLLGPLSRLQASLGLDSANLDLKTKLGFPVHVRMVRKQNLSASHRIVVRGSQYTLKLENKTNDYLSGFVLRMMDSVTGQLRYESADPVQVGVDGRIGAVSKVVKKFVDGITKGRFVGPTLKEGFRVQRIIHQALLSDRLKTWVNV